MFRLTIALALFGCALAGLVQPRLSDDIEGRIVGGEATSIDNYPYQVALLKGGSLFCGGSLYTPTKVITAAHCMQSYTASQIQVRVGSSQYASGGQLLNVKAFKFHELYDSGKMINDVALIALATPATLGPNVQTIQLASVVPPTGTQAVVTGWGTDKFLIGAVQSTLRAADVNIVPQLDCASEKYKYGTQILETMVCAAVEGGGKDACQGDSGGPLAAEGKLVGIVSWGNMCARKDYPGVYASVPELSSWIVKTAQELD